MGLLSPILTSTIFAQPRILKDQLAADLFTASGHSRAITGKRCRQHQALPRNACLDRSSGTDDRHAFINNLDLEVTVGGQTFRGNVFTGPTLRRGEPLTFATR